MPQAGRMPSRARYLSRWLFSETGGPSCGCPSSKSLIITMYLGVHFGAPDFWKLPDLNSRIRGRKYLGAPKYQQAQLGL